MISGDIKIKIKIYLLILSVGVMLAALACSRKGAQDSGVIEVSLADGRIEW